MLRSGWTDARWSHVLLVTETYDLYVFSRQSHDGRAVRVLKVFTATCRIPSQAL